jgi:hypothetical protein
LFTAGEKFRRRDAQPVSANGPRHGRAMPFSHDRWSYSSLGEDPARVMTNDQIRFGVTTKTMVGP